MIERNPDRRSYGRIRAHPHFLTTPPWVTMKPAAGRASKRKRPISVYTALSELRFVAEEDEDASSPSDPDSIPSPLSPLSQLKFASPDEVMTPTTPVEFQELLAKNSKLPHPATGVHEEQCRMMPIEELSPTTYSASMSPRPPGWATHRLGMLAISDATRVGRPLPELPEHAQSRPLPPKPTDMEPVPCWHSSGRFSYPFRQEFVQGSSRNPLAARRPVSDTGPDTRSQSIKYERPKLDPTPEDTPPAIHPKPPPAIVSSPTTVSPPPPPPPPPPPLTDLDPPAVAVPIILPTISKPDYPAPILSELLSPTSIDLVTASGLTISGENGEQISFGALFRDRKVVVIFIRHFWCLFCQDYIRSITNSVSPETLKKKGVDLVLIGNGAPGMIRAYKKTLKVPFTVYTDSSLQLHDALGLYKSSTVRTGCSRKQAAGRNYVKRNGRWTSLRIAVRAAAARAVHNGSGDFEQLGGEFVFGPGLKSSFVHKMQNTRDHAPIVEVLEAAGVEVREKVVVRASDVRSPTLSTPSLEVVDIDLTSTGSTPEPSPSLSSTTTASVAEELPTTGSSNLSRGDDDELESIVPGPTPTLIIENTEDWMVRRSNSLTRIKEKKEARRRGCVV